MNQPRGARRGRGFATAALLLLVGGAVGAVVGGRVAVGSPDDQVARPQPLTAQVSDDIQVDELALAVTSEPAHTITLPPRPDSVLTGVEIQPGEVARPCARLGTVNDEPLVTLPGRTQLFRDLARGDHGADVERLQASLAQCGHPSADKTGTFGPNTSAAVRAVTGMPSVRADNVVWLAPDIGAVVVARWGTDEGGALPSDAPALELRSRRVQVVAALDDPDEDRLGVGDQATVTDAAGRTGTAKVTAIESASPPSEEPPASDSDGSGEETSELAVPGETRRVVLSSDEISRPTTATWEVARSPKESLSVPLAAINDCGGSGSCITVVSGSRRRTVEVALLVTGETGVAVKPASPDDSLSVGDTVLLSGS